MSRLQVDLPTRRATIRLAQAVAPTLRCVVPDHIGMGLSDKPQDYPYTLAARVDDVAALVASLGLKKIHLVVHDWGGAIGFGFAARHPELIGRLVVRGYAWCVCSIINGDTTNGRAAYDGFAGRSEEHRLNSSHMSESRMPSSA